MNVACRQKPQTFEQYGVLIQYRTENQKDGRHMVFRFSRQASITEELHKKKKKMAIPKRLTDHDQEEIAKELAPRFLERILSLEKVGAGTEQERLLLQARSSLPLGVVWLADRRAIAAHYEWAESTAAEHERNMRQMLPVIGTMPLQDVIPSKCARLLMDRRCPMDKMTATLRRVVGYALMIGAVRVNPWMDYNPPRSRKSTSNSADLMIKRHLGPDMIPSETLHHILQECREIIRRTGDPMYFGALLCLLMPLTPAEICALQAGDIRQLDCFKKTLSVSVNKTLWAAKEHYLRVSPDIPSQVRSVPLPAQHADAFRELAASERCAELYRNQQQPLLFSKKNAARHLRPPQLLTWIFRSWSGQLSQICTAETLPTVLRNTVSRNLEKIGVESDEIRYLFGLPQMTTAGKHYGDFDMGPELNKLALVMDRWVNNLITESAAPFAEKGIRLTRQGQTIRIPAPAGNRIQVVIQVTVTSADKEPRDLTLSFGARRGLQNVRASFEKGVIS